MIKVKITIARVTRIAVVIVFSYIEGVGTEGSFLLVPYFSIYLVSHIILFFTGLLPIL